MSQRCLCLNRFSVKLRFKFASDICRGKFRRVESNLFNVMKAKFEIASTLQIGALFFCISTLEITFK